MNARLTEGARADWLGFRSEEAPDLPRTAPMRPQKTQRGRRAMNAERSRITTESSHTTATKGADGLETGHEASERYGGHQGTEGLTASCYSLPVHTSWASESLDMPSIGARLGAFGLPNGLPIVFRRALRDTHTGQDRGSEARAHGETSGSPTRRSSRQGLWEREIRRDLDPGVFSQERPLLGVTPQTNFVHTPPTGRLENRLDRLEVSHA